MTATKLSLPIKNANDAIHYLAEQRRWAINRLRWWNPAFFSLTWFLSSLPSTYSRRPARQSALIVSCGEFIIEGGHLSKLGDDLWATLEQVAIAALDLGRWELAEVSTQKNGISYLISNQIKKRRRRASWTSCWLPVSFVRACLQSIFTLVSFSFRQSPSTKWNIYSFEIQLCVARLHTRFPESLRVGCLQGMLMEAHGELSKALQLYDELLVGDETNTVRLLGETKIVWQTNIKNDWKVALISYRYFFHPPPLSFIR